MIEGLIPSSETGVARDIDRKRAFPSRRRRGCYPEVDAPAARTRLSSQATRAGEEVEEVRESRSAARARQQRDLHCSRNKLRNAFTPRKPCAAAVFIVMPARRPEYWNRPS